MLCCIVALLPRSGIGVAGTATSVFSGQPRIECRRPIYDFGSVDNRETVTNTFVLENRGTAPLHIVGVRACCGSSAKLSSMTLPPAGDARLEVSLSLARRRGRQIKTIYVMSDDPVEPRFRLQLKGTAVAVVDVQPDFLNFGRVESDYADAKDLRVFTGNGDAFRVTNVVSTVPSFAAQAAEEGSNSWRVTVRTVPPLPQGLTHAAIHVLTDCQKQREVVVNAVVTVSGGLLTIPRELVLTATVGKNEQVERYFVVRARDNKAFRILDTELPNSDAQIAVVPLSSAAYRCVVSRLVPGPSLNGERIVLTTDRSGSERIEIPIRVILHAPPPDEGTAR